MAEDHLARLVAQLLSVGAGKPLTLAANGVLTPYLTGGGTVALVEVASPVQGNPNLQLVFVNAACVRGGAVSLPETVNDIGFVDVSSVVPAGQSGVVAIAGVAGDGVTLVPLTSPIHTRVYLFNASDGRSRVLEPIVLDAAEAPAGPNTWSPLRSGATFYTPLQTATVNTGLTPLICPIATKVRSGRITSSPGPRPRACRARCKAAVPLDTATAPGIR